MTTNYLTTHFIARGVIYNVDTLNLSYPFNIGMFRFCQYPDEVAVRYHLGQGEESKDWDPLYPTWYNYVEFEFSVTQENLFALSAVDQWLAEERAVNLLHKFVTILQLYSTTPLLGMMHAVRSTSKTEFSAQHLLPVPRRVGGDPFEPEVFFITQDNIQVIRNLYDSFWEVDWSLIQLSVSRYMSSFTRDIWAEGLEPADAWMDLMIALESLFGSPDGISYKIALRAACLLEATADGRQSLNKTIKGWYRKRNNIAHGNQSKQGLDWKEVEQLREVVRRSNLAVWKLQSKGDALDDYLFIGTRYDRIFDES